MGCTYVKFELLAGVDEPLEVTGGDGFVDQVHGDLGWDVVKKAKARVTCLNRRGLRHPSGTCTSHTLHFFIAGNEGQDKEPFSLTPFPLHYMLLQGKPFVQLIFAWHQWSSPSQILLDSPPTAGTPSPCGAGMRAMRTCVVSAASRLTAVVLIARSLATTFGVNAHIASTCTAFSNGSILRTARASARWTVDNGL
ncbi:hypothetical protein BC936DRAFT_147440 [Jimgerdemannia flammicorona]|uniref:Uncharacterized protein n=1 Tax=Jimgerdemannia flammicorona TaxID=994334 RepID=A0A433D5C0_9FUNG|nr:hypothetical protein BC936DRAFT_147440 [Jimgerdemannia flammicorona]